MNALANDNMMDTLQRPVAAVSARRRLWRWAIVAIIIAVYLANLSPHWWVGKDGALYLCLARNMVRGNGYSMAGEAHTLVPPGYPAMLAGLMSLGADSFLAMNLVMGLAGLAVALAGYLLLRQVIHRDWALLVAGAFAICNELIQRSGEVLTDVPFTLLILSGMWLYQRGLRRDRPDRSGWEIASVLLVASCWIRMAGLPLAGAAAVGLVLSAWKSGRRRAVLNLLIVVVGCVLTVSFFTYYAKSHAGHSAASYVGGLGHYVQSLSGSERLAMPARRVYTASRSLSRFLFTQKPPGYVCLVLMVVPVLMAMVRRVRRADWIGPLAVACYIGGMCAAMVEVETRYLLPVGPLVMLYLVEGWTWILQRFARAKVRVLVSVAGGLLVVMAATNMIKAGRMIVEKHQDDYARTQQGGKWRDLQPTVEFLSSRDEPGAVLGDYAYGYLADRQVPSLSRRLRFSQPSESQLRELLQRWNVRFVVLSTRGEPRPFHLALEAYLARFGPAAFVSGDVKVYFVPLELSTADTQPSARPPESKQTQP